MISLQEKKSAVSNSEARKSPEARDPSGVTKQITDGGTSSSSFDLAVLLDQLGVGRPWH